MSKSEVSLSFFGAAGTVTGSRYLLESGNTRVLVDCGLFQGYKHLRQKNWRAFPVKPSTVQAVFLTHAHLDHSGYIPALVKAGFKGRVYCTRATRDLCEILLLDSAKIQEEQAHFLNKHGISKHKPALPLYSMEEARRALSLFECVDSCGSGPSLEYESVDLGELKVRFLPNGHILGSSSIAMNIAGRRVLFSGDLGRAEDRIFYPPSAPEACDYLITESTYGDRLHEQEDVDMCIADIINDAIARGGTILIPAFAVGRSQLILHVVQQLQFKKWIPDIPIYFDSPMAIEATRLFLENDHLHRLNHQQCRQLSRHVKFLKTVEESMTLNKIKTPSIIISSSGMATGGRVLHHLQRLLPDDRNTVLFTGYQAGGTRGARLVGGQSPVKILGHYVPARARIENLDSLSAHADREEIIAWLQQLPVPPKQLFITHGEVEASDQLRLAIADQLGWKAEVASMGDRVTL